MHLLLVPDINTKASSIDMILSDKSDLNDELIWTFINESGTRIELTTTEL